MKFDESEEGEHQHCSHTDNRQRLLELCHGGYPKEVHHKGHSGKNYAGPDGRNLGEHGRNVLSQCAGRDASAEKHREPPKGVYPTRQRSQSQGRQSIVPALVPKHTGKDQHWDHSQYTANENSKAIGDPGGTSGLLGSQTDAGKNPSHRASGSDSYKSGKIQLFLLLLHVRNPL